MCDYFQIPKNVYIVILEVLSTTFHTRDFIEMPSSFIYTFTSSLIENRLWEQSLRDICKQIIMFRFTMASYPIIYLSIENIHPSILYVLRESFLVGVLSQKKIEWIIIALVDHHYRCMHFNQFFFFNPNTNSKFSGNQ